MKILPPSCVVMEEKHNPYWETIIATRADWLDLHLIMAAHLARMLHELNEEQRLLATEGSVTAGRLNPRTRIVQSLLRQSLKLSSTIGIDAATTMGRSSAQVKKNQTARQARTAFEDDEDDLISKPVTEH